MVVAHLRCVCVCSSCYPTLTNKSIHCMNWTKCLYGNDLMLLLVCFVRARLPVNKPDYQVALIRKRQHRDLLAKQQFQYSTYNASTVRTRSNASTVRTSSNASTVRTSSNSSTVRTMPVQYVQTAMPVQYVKGACLVRLNVEAAACLCRLSRSMHCISVSVELLRFCAGYPDQCTALKYLLSCCVSVQAIQINALHQRIF